MPRQTEHNDETNLTDSELLGICPPGMYEMPQRQQAPMKSPANTTNALFPIMRRRKTMASGIFLLVFGTGLFAIESAPPIYRAHAKLSITSPNKPLVRTQLQKLYEEPQTPENISLTLFADSDIVDVTNHNHQDSQSATNTLDRFINDITAHINSYAKNVFSEKAAPTRHNIPESQAYIDAKNKYLILKTKLSAFINKDGSINIHKNEQAQEKLSSEALDKLLGQERNHAYELETLSLRYGKKHPKIIETSKKLATVTAQIREERETLLGKLIDDYILAKKTFDALKEENETLATDNTTQDKLPPLIEILEPAQPANEPVVANKSRLTGITLFLALFLSVLIPVIVEKRRKTFISGRELSHFFGLPCYALLPWTEREEGRTLADHPLDNPEEPLNEALHSLRLNIRLRRNRSQSEEKDKVVLVTSSENGEGKTMLCAWLGRIAAKSGEHVLLIDANLRDPCLHKALNGKNTLSLVEYLSGKATLENVTDTTDPSGLHAIYGRAIPNSVPDLLSSKKMEEFLEDVRKSYDLIIIDTPPCLENADARALASGTDLILYLVEWNKTKRNVIHKGLLQFLESARIRTTLVLSNIDLKKHTEYGFGKVIYEEED